MTTDNPLDSWDAPDTRPFPPARLRYIEVADTISLSYSKLNMLHECPRKFMLHNIEHRGTFQPNIHLAFGHAYGAGVQTFIHYATLWRDREDGKQLALERAIAAAIANWDMYDLLAYDANSNKNFGTVVSAIRIFADDSAQLIADYDIFMFDCADGTQKAANELLVYAHIVDGYSMQMHIDCILQHRETKQLAVVEIKTGSRPFDSSDYANSSQSMGYCAALQAKFGMHNVQPISIYICYDAKNSQHYLFEFVRDIHVGMEWAATLALDIEQLDRYVTESFWPRRGNACKTFGRQCQFFGSCNMTQYNRSSGVSSYQADGIESADIVIDSAQILALMDG